MDNNETLFWKVYRNQFINYQIFTKLHKRECLTKKYKEIHEIEWMRKKYPKLLIDKIKRNEYLTYTENDIKELLSDKTIFKEDNGSQEIELQCLIQLRDYYEIDNFLATNNYNWDIIKLSIYSNNLNSLKVFSATIEPDSIKETTSYLDDALLKNNFEIIQYVYSNIGCKNFNKEMLYQYLFDKPNEKVIEFAIQVMGIEFNVCEIPIWSLFKLPIQLINTIYNNNNNNNNNNKNKIIQITEPISAFNNFFYDFFKGTINDLIYHSLLLIFIEETYRSNQLSENSNYKELLCELSNLVKQAQNEISGEKQQLYYINNENDISIKMLKVYKGIIMERCWRNDFYYLTSSSENGSVVLSSNYGNGLTTNNFSLIEYAIRFNDIELLERIDQDNKLSIAILDKSAEYCNQFIFNWAIKSKFTKAKRFQFYLKTNEKIFYKLLLQENNKNYEEIKEFINNCIIGNIELIEPNGLFQVLIQLGNWELFYYVYQNTYKKIKSTTTMILPIIEDSNFLENILKDKCIMKFFRLEKWENPESLLKRLRFDLVDLLDKFKLLESYKSNSDNAGKIIVNHWYELEVVEYLIKNNYLFPQDSILVELVNGFNSKHSYKLSIKKFKLLLELCSNTGNGNISYGRGFGAMMVYLSTPSAISFINDYRPYDIENGRFTFKSSLLDMEVDTERMFHFLLNSGKYNDLIKYITEIKVKENMLLWFIEIGKYGITELIKIYFNYLKLKEEDGGIVSNNTVENTEIEPIPTSTNYLYSILSGSIKYGHLHIVLLFEKHYPQLFKKDEWSQFITNFNPFHSKTNYKFKKLESHIQNLIN